MPLTASNLKNKNIVSLAVILISVLSALFFIVLFSSVRCEPDDMIISLEIRDGSFLKAFLDRHNFYSFRPVYTLGAFATIGYSGNPANYPISIFIFYVGVYTLFLFSIYKLLQKTFSLKNQSLLDKCLLLSLSNILIICLYFLTTERIEIFGWVSASIIHLVPIAFIFFSAWLIIKKNKKTDYLLLIIAAAFIAGGAEHIAASIITSILGISIVVFYVNRKNKSFYTTNKPQIIKTAFFTVILSLFLLVCVSNPGVGLHYNEVHQQSDGFAAHHTVNILDAIKMFCKPQKLIGLVFLISFWFLFQNAFQITGKKIRLTYFAIIVCCVMGVTTVASILAYHTLSVGRIWFAFDVALFVLLSACIIKFIDRLKINIGILYAGAGMFLITLTLFDIRHIPALLNFSSQHDKLIYSLQQKPAEETIVLQSFPNPDLTNQVELSADPNNDVNQLFCRFYNIKAKVSVKK